MKNLNFYKLVYFFFAGLLLLLISCSHIIHFGKHKTALNGLKNVESYAVVYSKQPLTKFKPFDLLILEAENYSKFEVKALKKLHKTVLAYLNIGEIETYRPFYHRVKSDWFLEKNEEWPDHYFINPAKKGWRNLLIKQVIPKYLNKGFQGFLFDSVDLAAPYRFPEYHSAMIKLIKSLHKSFPNAMLILNNGEFLLEEVITNIHGLLIEEVFTERVNEKLVRLRSKEKYCPRIQNLANTKNKWEIPTFVMEYFPTEEIFTKEDIFQQSQKYELIPYITDQYALQVYEDYVKFQDKIADRAGEIDVSGNK